MSSFRDPFRPAKAAPDVAGSERHPSFGSDSKHAADSTAIPGGGMNFTSALYLGLRHPSRLLRPWPSFTPGYPAAFASPPQAVRAAQQLAQLLGCERGLLGTSTLHLFWDLFGMLARRPVAIYADAELYPIARWGVERAAGRGVPVRRFAHHDADALRRMLRRDRQGSLRPIVVTDGVCPDCGKPAPLPSYAESVRVNGGQLIVDDTQALGIFGAGCSLKAPYGREGGGMLRRCDVGGPEVLVISSLAKAFGAPIAVLGGSRAAIEEFEKNSETRMHCSPPSLASIHALEHALEVNRTHGDRLRLRLALLVIRFRREAARAGFRFTGGLFPVQTLAPGSRAETQRLHRGLLSRGVQAVLRQAPTGDGLRISFLITARHSPEAIDRAVATLSRLCALKEPLSLQRWTQK